MKNVMRHLMVVFVSVFLCGCAATVGIPDYIKDEHPYKRTFYADYPVTLKETRKVLTTLGWIITSETDPAIFEATKRLKDPSGKQILIFTRQKQGASTSKTTRINAYVRTIDATSTEVELRYYNLRTIPFKKFTSYRNDKVIDRVFAGIDKKVHR